MRKFRKAKTPKSDDFAENTSDDAAENKYASYQSHMGNMMMMGTLLFGFCVSGIFLSQTFTGEEPYQDNTHLVTFVRAGLKATVYSFASTVVSFIFSTRAAGRYLIHGVHAALRTLYKTTFFIGAAEILIYLSLLNFMTGLEAYARMNYLGPKLCPQGNYGEGHREWSNSSFCGQLGDDFYEAATAVCGAARKVNLTGSSHALWACHGISRTQSDPEPFALCNVFDCLKAQNDQLPVGRSAWFVWSLEYNINGYNTIFGDQKGNQHLMDTREAWNRATKEAAEAMCEKNEAQTLKETTCSTQVDHAACAQARSTYLQADDCSGLKQDDALKCKKVCQWYHEGSDEVPLKVAIGENIEHYFNAITYITWAVILFRTVANLSMTARAFYRFKDDYATRSAPLHFVSILDVFGLFDGACVPGISRGKTFMESEENRIEDKKLMGTSPGSSPSTSLMESKGNRVEDSCRSGGSSSSSDLEKAYP